MGIRALICEAIKYVQNQKKQKGIIPDYCMYLELANRLHSTTKLTETQITKSLNQMYSDGVIQVGKTLNDKYIKLK